MGDGGIPGVTTETSRIEDFTDLRVWQAAMDLCVNVYAFTKLFPKDER